jgi:hypothetical protein
MTHKTLDELFAEEEAALLAKAKAEIAREDAEWAALPPDQKLAIIAEREAQRAALQEAVDLAKAALKAEREST